MEIVIQIAKIMLSMGALFNIFKKEYDKALLKTTICYLLSQYM